MTNLTAEELALFEPVPATTADLQPRALLPAEPQPLNQAQALAETNVMPAPPRRRMIVEDVPNPDATVSAAELAAVLPPDAPPNDPNAPPPAKRGRKPGSKNKPKVEAEQGGGVVDESAEPQSVTEALESQPALTPVFPVPNVGERQRVALALLPRFAICNDNPEEAARDAYRYADAFLSFKG